MPHLLPPFNAACSRPPLLDLELDRRDACAVLLPSTRPQQLSPAGCVAFRSWRRAQFGTNASESTRTIRRGTLEFANSVESVVLVDGARLADLMIDHEVGVSLRPVRIPKLDSDYFEEESG